MSLAPRWFNRQPNPKRRTNESFNLGQFFEDLESEITQPNITGLSVSSDDKNFYVEVNVPGLAAKDVEVSIDNNHVLWIKGEKQEEDKNKKYYRRSQSSFEYYVPLWEEIDMSIEPKAVCKDGVMKVTFTKKKEKQAGSKKIQVKEKE